jgi:hypothetical protein
MKISEEYRLAGVIHTKFCKVCEFVEFGED